MREKQEEIEKWFIKRGLPHFIDDYSASKDILTRALPYLIGIFLVELLFVGELSDKRTLLFNVVALTAVCIFVLCIWLIVNRLRKRKAFSMPNSVGPLELIVFVFGPSTALLIAGNQTQQALTIFIVNLFVLLVLYFGTSYGVVPIAIWVIGVTKRQIYDVFGLLVRSLPLILLFSVIIFLTGEIWQMTAGNNLLFFIISLGIIALTGVVFAVFKIPEQISNLSQKQEPEIAQQLLEETPAQGIDIESSATPPDLTKRQWGNVGLVVVISEGIQGLIVSILVTAFFVLFGLFAISIDTITIWIGMDPNVLASLNIFGNEINFTEELIRTATFAGVVSGLYFTVNSLTDQNYKKEFLEGLLSEVRIAFAVRNAYHSLLSKNAPK